MSKADYKFVNSWNSVVFGHIIPTAPWARIRLSSPLPLGAKGVAHAQSSDQPFICLDFAGLNL